MRIEQIMQDFLQDSMSGVGLMRPMMRFSAVSEAPSIPDNDRKDFDAMHNEQKKLRLHVHVEAVVTAGGEGGSHREVGHATVILAKGGRAEPIKKRSGCHRQNKTGAVVTAVTEERSSPPTNT